MLWGISLATATLPIRHFFALDYDVPMTVVFSFQSYGTSRGLSIGFQSSDIGFTTCMNRDSEPLLGKKDLIAVVIKPFFSFFLYLAPKYR